MKDATPASQYHLLVIGSVVTAMRCAATVKTTALAHKVMKEVDCYTKTYGTLKKKFEFFPQLSLYTITPSF